MKVPKLPWGDDVDDDHYDEAYDYLSLHWLPAQARGAIEALRKADIVKYNPGDLLRASQLPLLPLTDEGVQRELRKAIAASTIAPLLCINLKHGIVIADGYHRCSFAYHLAPFDKVPLKLGPSPKDAFEGPGL